MLKTAHVTCPKRNTHVFAGTRIREPAQCRTRILTLVICVAPKITKKTFTSRSFKVIIVGTLEKLVSACYDKGRFRGVFLSDFFVSGDLLTQQHEILSQ